MPFESPDIETFRLNLQASIDAVKKHKTDSHPAIKISSLLNVTIYVMATRFLEGSVKHIVYNCAIMRGDDSTALNNLESDLKKFNNPEFPKILALFSDKLAFNVLDGKTTGRFQERDITFLNEIVRNRHKNVHATPDSSEWYNQNKKDLNNFEQEFEGLIKILKYLDSICFNKSSGAFESN